MIRSLPPIARAAALALALGLLARAGAASAQAAPPTGWSLNRFEAAPAGERFLVAQHPTYGGGGFAPRFGLAVDYAHNPLLLRDTTQGSSAAVLRAMLVGHLQAGLVFHDRFHVHLTLPVSLFQDGPTPNLTGVGAAGAPALGDVRLGARVRVFGHADASAVSVHVGGEVFLPATLLGSTVTDNVTDGNIRGRAWAALAGRAGVLRWSATGGYHARPETATFGATGVTSELFASAGVALGLAGGRVSVGPEAWVTVPVGSIASAVSSELLVGARYQVTDALSVGLGAGPGLTTGLGTPTFRGVAGLAWAPERPARSPSDGDGDGVPDAGDACADVPAGDRPDPGRAGCPTRDADRDGVFDGDDLCADVPAGAHPDGARPGCPMSDGDGDGVVDTADLCADLPAGPTPDPARAGCPDGDRDDDAVRDSADLCADAPAGARPDPARAGCPMPDRDGDTVLDADDRCPEEVGAPSPDAARNGCPGLVAVQRGQIVVVEPVYFATGRDVILDRSFPTLNAVAEALVASPSIRRVSVEGHTDDVNTDAANLALSERRALNVAAFLVAHGVEAERLESHGLGESRPVRPLEGLDAAQRDAARAVNRRVEFRIVDPAAAPAPAAETPAAAAPEAPVAAPEAPAAAPEAPVAAPEAPVAAPEAPALAATPEAPAAATDAPEAPAPAARPVRRRSRRPRPVVPASPPVAPAAPAAAPAPSAPAAPAAPVSAPPASAPVSSAPPPGPRVDYVQH